MTSETFLDGRVVLHAGDSRDVLKTLADNSIDSIVCDPPYALVSIVKRFANSPRSERTENTENPYGRTGRGFMGQKWDNGETAFATEFWAECLRVLKPGGHVVAFSGTRTYHRMACAIEDAGFEVRDMLSWLYGSGFPKSHDVSKQLDKTAGHWRGRAGAVTISDQVAKGTEYERTDKGEPITAAAAAAAGWGTALKPACEPICFGRKPMSGTVAANWLQHGTGAINVDACRVGDREARELNRTASIGFGGSDAQGLVIDGGKGRWPANIVHDGSEEVVAAFPDVDGAASNGRKGAQGLYEDGMGAAAQVAGYADAGSAARFFYTAKADADDRLGSKHPTVKPVDLMQWLCRLVTPKGGTVLDPFAGTGTTGEAAFREGFKAVLIEREEEYQADIRRRMALVMAGPDERKRESIKAKLGDIPFEPGTLFSSPSAEAAE